MDKATLICSHYEEAVKKMAGYKEIFDLIFIDPPYPLYKVVKVQDFITLAAGVLSDEGMIVIEHDHKLEDTPPGFERYTKPFGGTHVSYFTRSG